MDRAPVGVVGAGMIGSVVVRGLVADGIPTEVYDVADAALARAVADGATACTSLDDLAAHCPIVLVCVVTAEQVAKVVTRLTSASADPPVIVVHSTVGPDPIRAVALAASPAVVIDAPVSDNRGDDVHRLFTFLGVRGDLPSEVAEVLRAYCHGFEVMGEIGAGQLVKLACNVISLITSSAVVEALALCQANGIDPDRAASAALNGSANSWVLANWAKLAPRPAIVRKDLTAALDAGRSAAVPMPVTAAARDASDVLFGSNAVGD